MFRPMVRKQRERIRKQLSMTWPTIREHPHSVSQTRERKKTKDAGGVGLPWMVEALHTLGRRLALGEAQALVELVHLLDGFVIERYNFLTPEIGRAIGL